jgi:positive regulator of sigma E activity
MQCSKCNAQNPEGKSFCGDCGARLQNKEPLTQINGAEIRAQIRAVLREELTDQRVVEVEITEKVLEKISNWAKLLGYFAGIPLAACFLVLGFLGVKKYSDLWQLASAAENKIGPVIAQAEVSAETVRKQTEKMKTESGAVEGQISALKPRIAAIEADSARLAVLEKTFDQKVASLQTSFDKRVTGIQGEVDQLKVAIRPPRWQVRTGMDQTAGSVSRTPLDVTIEDLVKIAPPGNVGALRNSGQRLGPVEFTTYRLQARIVMTKLEKPSGDYALVLQGASGATMRALLPDPDPKALDPSSPWKEEIAAVRQLVKEKLDPGFAYKNSDLKVRITGVGFFNTVHGQRGVAPNGIELHPVLNIEPLD